ncbi:hypothetical protein EH165_04220 [Nakamurella antarctica]|uniref:Uncharacterized protein n=1 Tax=Nakamurella antarctica TaxID=1902245 RepID=A0A3G8ZTZ0_9ACTN|nr:hypothetical protein [Nakamurella antarctica]AZI57486.1 hypothetical protein EH165_04220 [Nakamurella antarctica]
MRWEHLFADLEYQLAELEQAQDRSELADAERVAVGAVRLVERLAGSVGSPIRIGLSSGGAASGVLIRAGVDWLLVNESHGVDLMVSHAAVNFVEGLRAATGAAPSGIATKLDFRRALRAVARDRSPVTVSLGGGGEIAGTLDRVGADFIEVAVHAPWESRRSAAVQSVVTVPLAAVEVVRARPLG